MKKFLSSIVLVATLLCFAQLSFASQAETSIIVLSGDVGGTNARLRLTQLKDNEKHILANKTYKVADYDYNTPEIIHTFFSDYKIDVSNINSLCLAVNEPVKNGKAWNYDAEQLKKDLKIDSVLLINDLEAVGYGIESLKEKDLYLLQEGVPEKNGLKAFIAAGTWLGVGFASFDDGAKYVVHPSEGGHTNFAPSDDIQIGILKHLLKEISDASLKYSGKEYYGTIPTEQLLRGYGLVIIYNYFRTVNPFNYTEDEELKKLLVDSKDRPKEISDFALTHSDDQMSVKALETFVDIYGAKASDVAYTLIPRGGLYIVGNIAANILTKSPLDKIFMHAFSDSFLEDFPVWVVTNTEVGLQGAENCAFKLALSKVKTSDDQYVTPELEL